MGSYTELLIDNYPVFLSKSYVDPEIMTIFSERDKKSFQRKVSNRNNIVWGTLEDDSEETALVYNTTVGYAIDRLEIMGFTLEKMKIDFNVSKDSLINELKKNIKDNDIKELKKSYKTELKLLENSSFDDFLNAFLELRKKNIPYYKDDKEYDISSLAKYLIGDGWFLNFPTTQFRFYLRAYLESCEKDAFVIQDITEVTNAGYYAPTDHIREITNEILLNDYDINSKIIILTEGSSDRTIIERSMKLLYPHLIDYYSFMDFGLSNSSGGASSLVAQVKGFIGAGIKNRIIAIFDNDTAAFVARKGLEKVTIPENISILNYPNLSFAEHYPTLGPTGKQNINVNRLAGSIEIYLGLEILTDNSTNLIPVQWNGYDKSLKQYQGELIQKREVQKKFFLKLNDCESKQENINSYDWIGIRMILNTIFNAFKT